MTGSRAGAIDTPTNARSRRTRAALLDATRAILEEDGFDGLTMVAVAERAGVTRRSVYLHFPSRAALVDSLFGHIAETEGLEESTRKVWEAPDPVAALDEWAAHLARYAVRLLPVTRAVEQVRRTDDDAERHYRRVVQAQQANCRRLARDLDEVGRLASPWTVDTATDMLWALVSADVIEGLVMERRWPPRRLEDHLAVLFRSTFVRPDEG